jgi:adenylate cyclase
VRLRSALVLAIVSLLLSTVLLVAGSAYFNATRSASELTEEVLTQATDRVDRVVRSRLDVASSESAFMKSLFDHAQVRSDDLDGIARFELDILESQPTLSYLSFGRDATGELAQASRSGEGALRVRFLRRQGDGLALTDFAPEDGGLRLVRTEGNKDDNEPRSQPYYRAAREAKHAVWTETYPFFGEAAKLGAPGVTLATPVMAADGSLVGVLTADFDLRSTSEFLKNLDLFDHGAAFVVEYRSDGTRAVIAHPTPELLAQKPGAHGHGLVAVSIEDIKDPRVVAFANTLPSDLPAPANDVTPVRFVVEGARFVGGYRALRGGDVRWVVCALAPEADVLAEVHRNDRWTVAIILVATVCAVLLALWIGSKIARPLRAVADETVAIGRFRLELHPPAKTSIVEVAQLAAAVEEMKRNLRSFQKYVPSDVVRELVSKGVEANLGGQRKTLTIHFSDIVGFTSIAETTSPEALVAMLGEYLDEMTKPILASGGTVDKFIGDAVMAFWGAPRPDPLHALHACEAALANRDRLSVLNAEWEKAGRPRLDARAGLHTGEVIVGNIGTPERLDYTAIGDAVNLASRLEGLNKRYGTSLMISETTYALVKDVMVVRPLDRVSVKGKAKAVTVYELLGKREDVPSAAVERAARHAEAFALYVERKFAQAVDVLRDLVATDAHDVVARALLARCEAFIASPPGSDWDGAEHMTEK